MSDRETFEDFYANCGKLAWDATTKSFVCTGKEEDCDVWQKLCSLASDSGNSWKLIETAPKDGTSILFTDLSKSVNICWWGGNEYKGWGWRSDLTEDFGGQEYPVLWQPLPAVELS